MAASSLMLRQRRAKHAVAGASLQRQMQRNHSFKKKTYETN
jgi:hypothetical protein